MEIKGYVIVTRFGFFAAPERLAGHWFPAQSGSIHGATVYGTRKAAAKAIKKHSVDGFAEEKWG